MVTAKPRQERGFLPIKIVSAESITLLELFDCIVLEYESMLVWNVEIKELLTEDRCSDAVSVTY